MWQTTNFSTSSKSKMQRRAPLDNARGWSALQFPSSHAQTRFCRRTTAWPSLSAASRTRHTSTPSLSIVPVPVSAWIALTTLETRLATSHSLLIRASGVFHATVASRPSRTCPVPSSPGLDGDENATASPYGPQRRRHHSNSLLLTAFGHFADD